MVLLSPLSIAAGKCHGYNSCLPPLKADLQVFASIVHVRCVDTSCGTKLDHGVPTVGYGIESVHRLLKGEAICSDVDSGTANRAHRP